MDTSTGELPLFSALSWFATTKEDPQPSFSSILAEHTKEQKDEEALKGVEDGEKQLEGKGGVADSESTKEPGQAKEKHDS